MYKHTQRSFTAGRLDAELMGRQDLEQYYKGASELLNMSVRRQGYVAKRRGTDLACGLANLLGHTASVAAEDGGDGDSVAAADATPNAIARARLIPLVRERDEGYYILMTAGRAFLCSREGIRLMDGTWARSVGDYGLGDYAGESVEGDCRPFYVAVPYADGELADIDFCQSGDTVFLAHPAHRPGRIVFDGSSIAYSEITFDHWEWKRPAILSAVKKGVDSGISGAGTKTVQYVCTYVKDGIESQPSEPFAVSYTSPWKSGGIVTITCSKGGNAEEPDYYNVYKKVSTQFGLISTVGNPRSLTLDPEVSPVSEGANLSFCKRAAYIRYYYKKRKFYTIPEEVQVPALSDFMNSIPDSVDSGGGAIPFNGKYAVTPGGYGPECYVLPFIGGVVAPQGATFGFGEHGNTAITRIVVTLDNFQCFGDGSSRSNQMQIRRHYAGAKFRVTVKASLRYDEGSTAPAEKTYVSDMVACGSPYEDDTEPDSTSEWAGSRKTRDTSAGLIIQWDAASQANPRVERTAYAGKYPLYSKFGEHTPMRQVDVDFTAWLEKTFGTSVQQCQVKSIAVEAFMSDGKTPVDLLFCGVAFQSSLGDSNVVEDEYLTPDMSVTPPVSDSHFAKPGDYPACVGMDRQRLVFAATANDPFTFWMSRTGDLYDFTPHESIREDDALSATLAATEFPTIRHIAMGRDLMMFAEGGEWAVAPVGGNTLTYKTVSAKMQSAIGCERSLKPIAVGDELIFAKSGGETLLATRYVFQSDGYESSDLSVLSQWIARNNPIVRMAYRQRPESTVWCVLADGTLATLVYMKEHLVCAWSRHSLGGGWLARDVATSRAESNGSTEVMLLVERGGEFALWRVRDEIPVRSAAPAADGLMCMDGMRALAEGEPAPEGMEAVDAGPRRYAGYLFRAELATVRPEHPGAGPDRTIQHELKNAKDFEVRVLDSGGFSVAAEGVPDSLATRVDAGVAVGGDGSVSLASGDFRRVLAGNNTGDGRVRVSSETPWPLNILSLSVDYEIQPLSGSEG